MEPVARPRSPRAPGCRGTAAAPPTHPRALAWPPICRWLVSCVSSRGRRIAAVWSTCGRVLGALWHEISPGRSRRPTGGRQPRPGTCTRPLRSAALCRHAGRSRPSLSIRRRIFDDPPNSSSSGWCSLPSEWWTGGTSRPGQQRGTLHTLWGPGGHSRGGGPLLLLSEVRPRGPYYFPVSRQEGLSFH